MKTTADTPILASWKISEVLKHYPDLVEVLVDLSPAFGKLRNPLMRRVQTRLVTVAQAAEMAGLEPAGLTRTLNQAAGITPPSDMVDSPVRSGASGSPARPAWAGQAPVAAEIDVRPLMDRGEEPFRAIMDASRDVPVGSVLRLVAGFEPLPLYDAMNRKGFAHWGRQREDDAWEVHFLHEGREGTRAAADPQPVASTGIDWNAAATAEVTIDVSQLVPPEPMVKILQTLETLPDESRLLVHHVRRPIHLYTRLDEMGYAHETREPEPGRVEVMIQKPVADPAP